MPWSDEDDLDYDLPNGAHVSDVCVQCRAGWHSQCAAWFQEKFEGTGIDTHGECCCGGTYSATQHTLAILKRDAGMRTDAGLDTKPGDGIPDATPRTGNGNIKGDPGYIHPDAWRSTKKLGDLTDPQSTGRKRAKEMYPIPQGQTCEWAGLAKAGGGVVPIVGCIGYAASDIHHGPDKNTLNNAKASKGIGMLENVHWVCSNCHNTWHAENDPYYPKVNGVERDYVRDQATPFVPQDPTLVIHAHDATTRTDSPRQYDQIPKGRVVDRAPEEWDGSDE
jgi:hypothetical protein